jgi:hypothetical protein
VLLPAQAQNTDKHVPKYDQHKVFNPCFFDKGTEFRSASGAPGAKYWQNRADYKINTTLDTAKHRITGSVIITYTNNSPDALDFYGYNSIKISIGRFARAGYKLR